MEKRWAASACVIHPRSPSGKRCTEEPSALSLVLDSFGASGGVVFDEAKILPRKSPRPILSPWVKFAGGAGRIAFTILLVDGRGRGHVQNDSSGKDF